MAGRKKVTVTGFPLNCSAAKVKISLESHCQMEFDKFKFDKGEAEVELGDDKDIERFQQAIPKFWKFGTTEHRLTVKTKNCTCGPEALDYTDISDELHSFFCKKEEHIQLLKNTLQDIADVKFATDRPAPYIKITPFQTMVNQGNTPTDQFSFREKCIQKIKTFLASYKTATNENINIDNLRNVRQSCVHKRLNDLDEEDVCIQWTGDHKEILVVTGLETEVDSTVKEILDLIDIKNPRMFLLKENIRWLSRCGYIDKIRSDGDFVGINCKEDSNEIVFKGNENQIMKARLALINQLSCLVRDKVDFLTPSVNNFLIRERNEEQVLSRLTDIFRKKGMKAIVQVQGKVPCVWTNEQDLQKSKTVMNDEFSEKSVSLSSEEYQDATKLPAWDDLMADEEKDGLVQIDIKDSNVNIVGFKSRVNEAYKKIANFLDEKDTRKELFETKYGIAKFIVERDSSFGSCCKTNCVQYSVEYDPKTGILLQGKETNIQRARSNLIETEKEVKRKEYKLEMFMIGDYLKSDEGKTMVNQAGQENECMILVGNDDHPTQIVENADECQEVLHQTLSSLQPKEKAIGSEVTSGSISISVHQGDIVNEKNDVIVNSTNSKFDLSQGQVSNALISKGGSQILDEVQRASGARIRVTNGGNLSCQKIFHVAVPTNPLLIGDCVLNILEEAESKKFTSISIPALGAGASNLPFQEAQSIIQGFNDFIKKHRQTKHLKKVDVILYEKEKCHQFEEWLKPITSGTQNVTGAQVADVVPEFAKHNIEMKYQKKVDTDQSKIQHFHTGIINDSSGFGSTALLGPIRITVRQGDITMENSDAIINIVGKNFILSQAGLVAKAILSRGGGQIQTDVKAASGSMLRVTSGGNLSCKKIFHVVGVKNLNEIRDCVMDILMEADSQQCVSVSIPAIGTGKQSMQCSSVARELREAFQDFVKQNPQTNHLKKVDIVIFDQSMIQDFQTGIISALSASPGFSASTSSSKMTPTNEASSSGGFGTLTISVRQGDITDESNDAIVNSTASNFDLSAGMVAGAILKKGGQSIQDEVYAVSGTDIRVTNAGGLNCNKIFHVAFPEAIGGIKNSIVKLLHYIEEEKCTSVSIPAIGTGNKGISDSAIASAVTEAIQEFAQIMPQTQYLKVVDLIIYDNPKLQAFQKALGSVKSSAQVSPQSSFQVTQQQERDLRHMEISIGAKSEVTAKHPRENSIMIYIYAQKKDKPDKALNMIETEWRKVYMDQSIHVPDYDQLTDWELLKIEEIAVEKNVQLTKKKEQKEIVVTGARSDVTQASKIIVDKVTTFSKAKAVKSHALFTWQYKDSNQAWADFSATANTALEESHKNTDLQKIELNLDFEDGEQKCEVDFMDMKMSCGMKLVNIRRVVKTELPRHWDDMKEKDHLVVNLDSNSDEYKKVEKEMRKNLPNCQILSIGRIQNAKLYIHYREQKKLVEKSVKNEILEQQLFHGTKASTSQEIIESGFNRSYCGYNTGAMYGNGVYFAKNAKYSSAPQYSKPDRNGIKTMLLAHVITGDYCKGKDGLIVLDKKSGGARYESAVDNRRDPQIFVVFEDASAYPAYIIKYHL